MLKDKRQPFTRAFLTILLFYFFIFNPARAADQQSPDDKELKSEAAGKIFLDMANQITNRASTSPSDVNEAKAEQAIVFFEAARKIDNKVSAWPELVEMINLRTKKDHSALMEQILVENLNERADMSILKNTAAYLLNKANDRETRENLIIRLLQNYLGRNNNLDSELYTTYAILRQEVADVNATGFFYRAYSLNQYNRLAFTKLIELAGEKVPPYARLEYFRLILGENPLDIETAVSFAEQARGLELYETADSAYQYCADLYGYLYSSEPLPAYIYLPWSMSAYNSPRNQVKCLQIAERVESRGRFDLVLDAIAAKAAQKAGDIERSKKILEDAKKKAKEQYLTADSNGVSHLPADSKGKKQKTKFEIAQELAWLYCFVQPDANEAYEWSSKAYQTEPNSATTAGLFAYALLMKNQVKEATAVAEKFPQNQIACLVMGKIKLSEGQKDEAISKLKAAISKDPSSFESEVAKQVYFDANGIKYTPDVNNDLAMEMLKKSLNRSIVPTFATPDKLISFDFSLKGSRFEYGEDIDGILIIKNISAEPLIISDQGLFMGNIRIDCRINGDLIKTIPNLVNVHIEPTKPVEPGKSISKELNLLTGQMLQILQSHPQAKLGIEFTIYLDPVVTRENKVVNRLADIKPLENRTSRPAVQITPQYLQHLVNSFNKGWKGLNVKRIQLFGGLLAEQQDAVVLKTYSKNILTGHNKDLLRSLLLSSLKDEDWVTRIRAIQALSMLPGNAKLVSAVSDRLNDAYWPVRLMALYQLSETSPDFQKVLDWTANYDSSQIVKDMATALGAKEPAAESKLTANLPKIMDSNQPSTKKTETN